jgi:3-phenylpropionate/cinnamic acid dioxygenase small subunit
MLASPAVLRTAGAVVLLRHDSAVLDPEEAIRGLICAYAALLDAGDLDGVAALFADGTFRSARDGSTRTGAGEVRAMYGSVILYDDGTPRTKHVLGNIEITLDASGTTATSWCTFSVLQAAAEAPLSVVLAGRYEDHFECRKGTWGFAERVVHPDLLGKLSRHMRPS